MQTVGASEPLLRRKITSKISGLKKLQYTVDMYEIDFKGEPKRIVVSRVTDGHVAKQ